MPLGEVEEEVPAITFEYAAIYYLNWWLAKDRQYCAALASEDRGMRLGALRKAATAYRVARNMPTAYDVDLGLERFEPALKVIDGINRLPEEEGQLVSTILGIKDKLSNAYGGDDVLSLTTKFLWLVFKKPVVIYDGNCRRALQTRDGDLSGYLKVWRADFQKHAEEIQSACGVLQEMSRFTISGVEIGNEQQIRTVSSEAWFHERVWDIYLWFRGA